MVTVDKHHEADAIAARLRAAMESRGLSVKDLAAIVGMSPNGVSELLNGRNLTQWVKLQNMAAALGVTADHILGISESTDPEAFELFRDGIEAILIDLGWPPSVAAETVGIAADTAAARAIIGQDRRLENRAVAVARSRDSQRRPRKS
jgi:transcriptional regulator with XRE-family HTH domain